MGIDLRGSKGVGERFSGAGWGLMLDVMRKYGWVPEGTTLDPPTELELQEMREEGIEPGEREKWDGSYGSSDGQRVSESDAAGMASACDRARVDPKLVVILVPVLRRYYRGSCPSPEKLGEEAEAYRGLLATFAVFCRLGSFRIS